MNQTRAGLVGILVFMAGVLCVIWLWPRGTKIVPTATANRPSPGVSPNPGPADPAPAAPAAPSPEIRRLLASLEALLRQGEVRAREALLTFKDDAALRRFLRRAENSGLTVVGQLPALRTVRVRHREFSALQDELLNHAGDYDTISANALVRVPSLPAPDDRPEIENVPFGNRTLNYLSANRRELAYKDWGRGVTIAILDTGVSGDATFGTGRLSALDVGFGLAPDAGPGAGHGTAVASLAGGLAPDAGGVAPAASLLSIRVTDDGGASDLFTLSRAIVAAADAGARIINISLGGYSTAAVLGAALDHAQARGAVIVAAAGNDQAAQLAWPAADSRVVSVGAIDAAGQQVSFSNASPQLQLTAPGYGVQTAWLEGQRVYVDGTSASAPLVAGAIAAVMSQHPALTAAQAAQIVIQTASDAGREGADAAFGHGILNLDWAMNHQRHGYVDTAISSHAYDEARKELTVVVQNRSAQPVAGLALNVSVNGSPALPQGMIPSLAPGGTWVARVPVDPLALKVPGGPAFTSQLVNPPGTNDAVPGNNQKTSALPAPENP